MLLVNNSLYYYLQYRNLFGKETFLTVYCHFDFHTCQALLSMWNRKMPKFTASTADRSLENSLFFWYDLKHMKFSSNSYSLPFLGESS